MAKTDNSLTYAVLGFFSGPIGGAFLGYQYAKKKQQLYTVNPKADRSWDNPWINVAVGIVGGGIGLSGALFGYNYAKLDKEVEKLTDAQEVARRTQQAPAQGKAPEQQRLPEPVSQKWRDFVSQPTQNNEIMH